ncbi:MAG: hypothetical protein Q8L48_26195 [Archangium sp.]|nr:hypothetical protein [Archangium sp.]
MRPFASGELRIDVIALSVTRFRLDWRGRSASRAPGVDLQPYLAAVLTEARNTQATIEMHFEALEYFNSSTVAVLIDFVRAACGVKVPVTISYSAEVRWQRLSFQALQVFSLMDQHIKVAPISASAPA